MKKNLLALFMVFTMIFTFAVPAMAAAASPTAVNVNFELTVDKTVVKKGETVIATLTMTPAGEVSLTALTHTISYDAEYFDANVVPGTGFGYNTNSGAVTISKANADAVSYTAATTLATVTLTAKKDVTTTTVSHATGAISDNSDDYDVNSLITGTTTHNIQIKNSRAVNYTLNASATTTNLNTDITVTLTATPQGINQLADLTGISQTITYNSTYFTAKSASSSYGLTVDYSNAGEITISGTPTSAVTSASALASVVLTAKAATSTTTAITHTSASMTAENTEFSHTSADSVNVTIKNNTVQGSSYSLILDYDSTKGTVRTSTLNGGNFYVEIVPKSGCTITTNYIELKQNGVKVAGSRVTYEGNNYYHVTFESLIPGVTPVLDVDFQGTPSSSNPGTGTGEDQLAIFTFDDAHGFAYVDNFSDEMNEIGVIKAGATVTVRTHPDSGYKALVTVRNRTTNSLVTVTSYGNTYTFTMPNAAAEINVTFVLSETITGDYDIYYDYSSVWLDYIDTPFSSADAGKLVYFDMITDSGVVVDDIKILTYRGVDTGIVCYGDENDRYYFRMPAYDVTVQIDFTYGSGGSTGGYGSSHKVDVAYNSTQGSATVGAETYRTNERVYVYPTAKAGYTVDYVLILCENGDMFDATKSGSTYYFTMPDQDVIVNVFFKEGSGSGTTTPSTGRYSVTLDTYDTTKGTAAVSVSKANMGDTVYVTATPKSGVTVDVIVVNASTNRMITVTKSSSGSLYSFTMPNANVIVMVAFSGTGTGTGTTTPDTDDGTYKITLNYDKDHGNVKLNMTSGEQNNTVRIYYYDSDVRNVVVTNKTTGERITTSHLAVSKYYYFRMPASDVEVKVIFESEIAKTYSITKGVVAGGTVNISATSSEADKKITVTATPNFGYKLDGIIVNTANDTVITGKNADGSYSFIMPEANVTVSVVFTKELIHVCPIAFTDVTTDAWYHEFVDYMVSNKLMNGMTTTPATFAPDFSTSRAMIVTVLWRMAGEPVVNTYVPFTDVPAGAYYEKAVRWAYSNGMLQHTADGTTFGPDLELTREQLAFMFYTYEKQTNGISASDLSGHNINFNDIGNLSTWAYEAVVWCNKNGILQGDNLNNLTPKSPVLRSHLAKMVTVYHRAK